MCPNDHGSASSATSSSSETEPTDLSEVDPSLFDILSDAHCHIHDDIPNIPNISKICRTGRVLLMGVDPGDWGDVERSLELNNEKKTEEDVEPDNDIQSLSLTQKKPAQLVPAFGCHPWYAFCVSTSGTDYGVKDQVDEVFELAPETEGQTEEEKANRRLAKELMEKDLVPFDIWVSSLKSLLLKYPEALVGEIGLDKNATVRGTDLRVNPKHQLAVARKQFEIAAEMKRPVSFHLVNRPGWFIDLARGFIVSADDLAADGIVVEGSGSKKSKKKGRPPQQSSNLGKSLNKPLKIANPVWTGPPAICLHSYSGSVALIDTLRALPGGAGSTFYFSHSIVINSRSPSFEDRIRATPDDRLLIESDYDRPSMVDEMVLEMCKVVARVKGWTLQEAAIKTRENLERFLGARATAA